MLPKRILGEMRRATCRQRFDQMTVYTPAKWLPGLLPALHRAGSRGSQLYKSLGEAIVAMSCTKSIHCQAKSSSES